VKSFVDRNPYAIGIVSVLLIALATGFAFMAGILHLLEHTYTVHAVFSDASGVKRGDDVRVAGIKAGRVDGVKADRQRGTVVATLVVNHGVQLGPQTHAEVALQTLLGTKYVRLSGPVVRPYLEDVPTAARLIPRERTATPFDVFEITKIGTRSIENTETDKLNKLIGELADVSQDKHDQIAQLVTGLAKVSTAIHDRDAQLRELFDKADTLSGTLAEKDQTLVGLIDQSKGILDLVQRRRGDIATGIDRTTAAMSQLAAILSDSQVNLDAILTTLHPTVDIISANEAHIDRALGVLGPGALGLAMATSHGPWADIYVRGIGPDVVCLLAKSAGTVTTC
jgi:phospholipid/cholesterol/gamma-HCH transport system substrate-binding protein